MNYQSVVFAGGGSRCFWQAGFYAELAQNRELAPTQVAAVSAGSAMACLAVARRWDRALEEFKRVTAANQRNFYPRRLLSRTATAFPHLDMYRRTILSVMDDSAFEELKTGADIHVLLARPPAWIGPRLSALLAFAGYKLEKRLLGPVHPRAGQRLGFRPEVVRAQDCAGPEELADLILHSSCTPPFTPLFRRAGRPVLDGGAVDPVPTLALGDAPGRTLVLLTARYPRHRIPTTADTTYVQPSAEIPISTWDYANPDGLQAAYDLGRRDAEVFRRAAPLS